MKFTTIRHVDNDKLNMQLKQNNDKYLFSKRWMSHNSTTKCVQIISQITSSVISMLANMHWERLRISAFVYFVKKATFLILEVSQAFLKMIRE